MTIAEGGIPDFVLSGGFRRTAYEMVRETLRRAILSGDIPPGSVLVQTVLAQQLQVSTTPVREALRDLAAEGLISLDAHKSAIVLPGSLDEMEEIYSLRLLLEPYCVRQAIKRITEKEIEEAARIHERMLATERAAEWLALNSSFHKVLTDAAGSPRLSAILKGLREGAQVYIAMRVCGPAEIASGNREHAAILEAFRSRDEKAACAAILGHLETTRRMASEELA